MPRTLLPLAFLAALALPACGERVSPEKEANMAAARREACIAEELFVASRDRLTTIEETGRAHPEGDPMAVITQAASTFAKAYHARAAARWNEMALADSAAHAPSRDDSVRFAGEAAQHRLPPPAEGVEANAVRDYEQAFNAARLNPDHPCNQAQREGGAS